MERQIDLSDMSIRKAINIMMAEADVSTYADIARAIEMKETTLRSAISNESLRFEDFKKIANHLGFKVIASSK